MKNKAQALSLVHGLKDRLEEAAEGAASEEDLQQSVEDASTLEALIELENEQFVTPPVEPNPVGNVLAASVAEALELALQERQDIFIRLHAKPHASSDSQLILGIDNTIKLESVGEPFQVKLTTFDGEDSYWASQDLNDAGEYTVVIRILLSQEAETGLLEIINLTRPDGSPPLRFQIATMDSEDIQLQIGEADDISLFAIGDTLSAVLSV